MHVRIVIFIVISKKVQFHVADLFLRVHADLSMISFISIRSSIKNDMSVAIGLFSWVASATSTYKSSETTSLLLALETCQVTTLPFLKFCQQRELDWNSELDRAQKKTPWKWSRSRGWHSKRDAPRVKGQITCSPMFAPLPQTQTLKLRLYRNLTLKPGLHVFKEWWGSALHFPQPHRATSSSINPIIVGERIQLIKSVEYERQEASTPIMSNISRLRVSP